MRMVNRFGWLLCAALCATGLGVNSWGQQPAKPPATSAPTAAPVPTAAPASAPASGDEALTTFKSDVALVRVDAQVFDGYHRRVGNLRQKDFLLFDEGKPSQIRNFASEAAVMDILFLLDVSGSMRPNVQRVADAAGQALETLREEDRLAIMTFDESTRVQLHFTGKLREMENGFQRVLDRESFNGGTNISRGLSSAIKYMVKNGRPQARRAIVILTDDMTRPGTGVTGMAQELIRNEIVLNALLAPDIFQGPMGRGGGRRRGPTMGGGWPGGGGIGFPGGGGRFPGGGGQYPGGTMNPNVPAGTADTASESGGDSVSVEAASALETTLARIRQCYALFFHGVTAKEENQSRTIQLRLASAAAAKYPGATVVYRRTYISPLGDGSPVVNTEEPATEDLTNATTAATADEPAPVIRRRRVSMNEPSTNRGPNSAPTIAEGEATKEEVAAPPPLLRPLPPDPEPAPKARRRAVNEPSTNKPFASSQR